MDLKTVMQSVAKQMSSEFDLSCGIEHRVTKGTAREETVKNFLKQHLPAFLGVGSGEIISTDNQVSRQMDVVIYDAEKCPIIYRQSDVQVFPNEGVYTVIEVKSYLDSEELKKSIDIIASAKKLPKVAYYDEAVRISVGPLYGRTWPYFPTLGAIFAYDSMNLLNVGKVLERVSQEKNLPLYEQIDLVCVLNKGLVVNFIPDKNKVLCRPDISTKRVYAETQETLLQFYILLMQELPQAHMRPIKRSKYPRYRAAIRPLS